MDRFLDLLVDFMFYSYIEGAIFLVFLSMVCKRLDMLNVNKIMVHTIGISFGLSLITFLISHMIFMQLCMVFYISLYVIIFLKFPKIKSFVSCCILMFLIVIFEVFSCWAIDIIFDISILTLSLNSVYRLSCFSISKVFEILTIVLYWRKVKMKIIYGGTIPRK